jgi:wobble nucleotide-excising tRNase
MIQKVSIKNQATYDNIGQDLEHLQKINFIYGTNGSGKTTISKIINNVNDFIGCNLEWLNDSPIETFVYNQDFVKKSFFQDDKIKGIFTLGKTSQDIKDKIEAEKEKLKKEFESKCWNLKKKYANNFKGAFVGFLGSANSFTKKILVEINNSSEKQRIEFLKTKADTIFNNNLNKIPIISNLNLNNILDIEVSNKFSVRIVGNDELDISNIINKLNNSDWVQIGKQYLNQNDDICPFCQRTVEDDFKQQLEKYFDENYLEQLNKLNDIKLKYENTMNDIVLQIINYLEFDNIYLNKEILLNLKEQIELIYKNNLDLILKKVNEPSLIINLKTVKEHLEKIENILKIANISTEEYNNSIDNIEIERKTLKSQIWKFIVTEIENDYLTYHTKLKNLDKAIIGITNSNKDKQIQALTTSINILENQITNVQPTIDEINKILNSFGFNNFKLDKADENGSYKIVRDNGTDAKATLSEGEKTFITFLYFYQLLKGSISTENITIDRIVVFDDPISSLDSNILFIVSNLIREIINNIKDNKGNIKQIFILTHNVYFHKEVTFDKKRSQNLKMANETFLIVKKINKISKIVCYDYNPIKTSYELLWQEIKESNQSSNITIFNTLRRILENYFKILGNFNDDNIINKFDGEEQIICKALMSWINDGLHYIHDDLFIDSGDDTVDKYLYTFKKIFEYTNHLEHYKMILGE